MTVISICTALISHSIHTPQCDFLNSVIADLQRKLETAETMAGLHGPIDDNETSNYRYFLCVCAAVHVVRVGHCLIVHVAMVTTMMMTWPRDFPLLASFVTSVMCLMSMTLMTAQCRRPQTPRLTPCTTGSGRQEARTDLTVTTVKVCTYMQYM